MIELMSIGVANPIAGRLIGLTGVAVFSLIFAIWKLFFNIESLRKGESDGSRERT